MRNRLSLGVLMLCGLTACSQNLKPVSEQQIHTEMEQKPNKQQITSMVSKQADNKTVSDCTQQQGEVRTCTEQAGRSKSLKELPVGKGKPKAYKCADEYKNADGTCEVPNHPHPRVIRK